jgi:hypothetical protein
MLWLDVPRTLLLKPALGKAKRHAMHNPKITISHLNFDDYCKYSMIDFL